MTIDFSKDVSKCHIQIDIRSDGKVIWINIDGICALRITNPLSFTIDDGRISDGAL